MNAPRLSAVALAAGIAVMGCQTITELPTTSSSPSPSPTLQAIAIPITNVPTPTPAPTPAATPTPQQTPGPAPTPTPTPAPGGGSGDIHVYCAPAVAPDGLNCPKADPPAFVDVVATAILNLKQSQPQIFNDYLVLDRTAYYNGVFANLYGMGYCAAMDSEEVAVSTVADRYYRENYQILSSASKYRTGVNSHISACQVPH